MEFDGFQKDDVHWKALKIDLFRWCGWFSNHQNCQKNTKSSQTRPKIWPTLFETHSILGQYGFKRVDKKKMIKIRTQKKEWSLKLKFAVWCSGAARRHSAQRADKVRRRRHSRQTSWQLQLLSGSPNSSSKWLGNLISTSASCLCDFSDRIASLWRLCCKPLDSLLFKQQESKSIIIPLGAIPWV